MVYVEVQSYSIDENDGHRAKMLLTRKEAKTNLKLVIETTTGLKIENSRFDRYWFDERRAKLIEGSAGSLDNASSEQ